MGDRITLFTSNNKSREELNTYTCCIHCTGTFSDLKNSAQCFQSIFKKENGNGMDILKLQDKDDLQKFNYFIHLLKETLSFHVNIKNTTYYSFIYFWNNVLFKDFEIEDESLWYEMINDVYSYINKNDFISFVELHLARTFHHNKENFQKKTIENICHQIKISNVCTTDIKTHIGTFLPFTHNANAYIHKQLDVSAFRSLEFRHYIEFYQKEYIILARNEMTDKVYIDETVDYLPLFKGLSTKFLDIDVVDSSFKDVITMLNFFRDLFLHIFQKLEQTDIDKLERKRLFNIIFILLQLPQIDELELEIDDKTFEILQDFLKTH